MREHTFSTKSAADAYRRAVEGHLSDVDDRRLKTVAVVDGTPVPGAAREHDHDDATGAPEPAHLPTDADVDDRLHYRGQHATSHYWRPEAPVVELWTGGDPAFIVEVHRDGETEVVGETDDEQEAVALLNEAAEVVLA